MHRQINRCREERENIPVPDLLEGGERGGRARSRRAIHSNVLLVHGVLLHSLLAQRIIPILHRVVRPE